MDNKQKTWLLDIDNAIEEIFQFIKETEDFESFSNDLKTRKAAERNLEIIGEAVNRIEKHDDSVKIENSKRIIGTRNRIIHSYDNISVEIIWAIVKRELPNLKLEISKFLEK